MKRQVILIWSKSGTYAKNIYKYVINNPILKYNIACYEINDIETKWIDSVMSLEDTIPAVLVELMPQEVVRYPYECICGDNIIPFLDKYFNIEVNVQPINNPSPIVHTNPIITNTSPPVVNPTNNKGPTLKQLMERGEFRTLSELAGHTEKAKRKIEIHDNDPKLQNLSSIKGKNYVMSYLDIIQKGVETIDGNNTQDLISKIKMDFPANSEGKIKPKPEGMYCPKQ